ncbi:putative transcription factor bzip [Golovinomyces cichoracearum]|uniref:Putative transcription factor bzip n=1 Tax=Golovinomyces cichoracearum TaxID=62708 RepID=A0A420HAE2_9PEZI|nr:putative transcription factor bzip [Golovinomyces cichoracearum]
MLSTTTNITQYERPYQIKLSLSMDSTIDKDERKREYNRLAQREFRRRRKEHLKNLEQAQKDLSTERAEEIDRLRYQNEELRRENNALRARIYGTPSSNCQVVPTTSVHDNRQYSLSPSNSGASISATSSPSGAIVGSDFTNTGNLPLSTSMIGLSLQAYPEHDLSMQPYSMVHYLGIHHNVQSSPESSGYQISHSNMGQPIQPIKLEGQSIPSLVPLQRQASNLPTLTTTTYDRNRARAELSGIFRSLTSVPSISTDPQLHLATLRSLADTLPDPLKPTKLQLEKAHYFGIDMIASPSLRDRLILVRNDAARNFVDELGIMSAENDYANPLTIWGDDPLNEVFWELSKSMIERWGWMLGNEWIQRSNFWRSKRESRQLLQC